MGAKGSKKKQNDLNVTQLRNIDHDPEEFYDQFVNYRECCGFRIKKSHTFVLIWQETLLKSCQELKPDYPIWTQALIDLVKNNKMSRVKFLKEVSELKEQQLQPILQEKQILLTPSQIEDFKRNLKQSVLLSSGQATKSNRAKQSKIESVIMTPLKKQKSKTKNDELLTEFRKSRITREKSELIRQTSTMKKLKSGFRQSMISFVDDTLSSLFRGQSKQISKQSAHSLEIFVRFTVILQKHLKDPANKLCLLIKQFTECMYKNFNKQLVNAEQIQAFSNNIKVFLVLIRDAVEDYYNTPSFGDLDDNNNFLISNSENILTVVTTVLFKDHKFYDFTFSHIKRYNRQKDERLQKIVQSLTQKPPEFFQVKNEYCLNENSITESMKQKKQQMSIDKSDNGQNFPYKKCSQSLLTLQQTRTPISKMKIILDSAQNITECVSNFYGDSGLESKNCIFDADQILSIFCYVITKTKIKNFHSHLFILEHFATQNQLISMMGYYYSVLSCAVQQLQNVYGKDQDTEKQSL